MRAVICAALCLALRSNGSRSAHRAAEVVRRIAKRSVGWLEGQGMWISKVSEIIGSSPKSFEDAARSVLARANRSLLGITGIEVLDKRIKIEESEILEYRVRLRLVFDLAPEIESHW
jgi:flavin-binding protein dodecin